MKINKILFAILIYIPFSQNLFATSLDGTTNIVYKNIHYIFDNSDTATGFVRLRQGFTLPEHSQVTFKINSPVSSGIDLQTTGTLTLDSDLIFDPNISLSSSGFIKGNSNAIILNDDLTIPANKNLEIIGDTIINGNGHNLILDNWAQILVDGGVTLTLKNMTIKNVVNSIANPPIKLIDQYSKLSLNEVTLALNNDFAFPNGQLFIHNDVIFTGSSKFSYRSVLPSYITPHACLFFDIDTTFEYYPSCTRDDLIVLYNETSSVFLNGCTLQTTHTGIKLTKGRLFFDNKITLSNATNTTMITPNLEDNKDYGTYIYGVDWRPDGKYLALGGEGPFSGNELQIYSFENDTLTSYTSKNYGTRIYNPTWSPNGKYLAIGGHIPTSGDELQIYSFYNEDLSASPITSKNYGDYLIALKWRPDGKYLALGGINPTSGNELEIYSFNNEVLSSSPVAHFNFGAQVRSLDWHPNGQYLAVGGLNPFSGNELQIFSFQNDVLTSYTSKNLGSSSSTVLALEWSPDGQYLALGGVSFYSADEFQIYSFINDNLSTYTVDSKNDGTIRNIKWHPSGNYVAFGSSSATNDLEIYSFNNGSLSSSPIYGKSFGDDLYSIDWHPNRKYLALGGENPTSGYELEVYKINYMFDASSSTLSNAIKFGDSSKGSAYNLNTYVLSGATIEIDGLIWCDDAS